MRLRAVLSALVVALAAAAALGDDFEAGSLRREIEAAVKDRAQDRAVAVLDRVLDAATPRIRARHVEAAKAAVDLLPWDVAAARAARLFAEALHLDRSNRDGAWTAAQTHRKELIRRVDVETGERFLARLIEIYPDVPEYRRARAELLMNGSRREAARTELEALFRMAPSDTQTGFRLAVMAEEDGDVKSAIEYWDRLIRARPFDLWARFWKADVLSRNDRAAARVALEEGRRAADATENEADRAEYLEKFASLRDDMDAEDARRDGIRQTDERQRRATGAALAVWAVIAAFGWGATRTSPRVATGGPDGVSAEK